MARIIIPVISHHDAKLNYALLKNELKPLNELKSTLLLVFSRPNQTSIPPGPKSRENANNQDLSTGRSTTG